MTVPNPAQQPTPSQQPWPGGSQPGPAGRQAPAGSQPWPGGSQPAPGQIPPPAYGLAQSAPPRPPLPSAAAHRARLAGGVGGGLIWLGLHLAGVCLGLMAVRFFAPGLVGVLASAFGADPDDLAGLLPDATDWLGTPLGLSLVTGAALGAVLAIAGLIVSVRMLRAPGLAHPVGITFAGWGIALVALNVLSGLLSAVLSPLSGMLSMGAGGGMGWNGGDGPGGDWAGLGGASGFDDLIGILLPILAVSGLASVALATAASVFTWWWMAHAMRPKTAAAAPATA